MKAVRMLVKEASFDATGTLIAEGHVGTFDADRLTGEEKHLEPIGTDYAPPVIEIAAIAPTGPNPTAPQQIPPDGGQGPGGGYFQPGKVLVGEVTRPQDERLANISTPEEEAKADAKLGDLLADGNNDDDDLVAGNVADVVADLGAKTDDDLKALRAAEVDREKPRKGVLSAIDAELKGREA